MGSAEEVDLSLYTKKGNFVGNVYLRFSSPPVYSVTECLTYHQTIHNLPPLPTNKIITFTKTSTRIKLELNKVVILNIVLSETCGKPDWKEYWTQDVAEIFIEEYVDTASDSIRAKPTGEYLTYLH